MTVTTAYFISLTHAYVYLSIYLSIYLFIYIYIQIWREIDIFVVAVLLIMIPFGFICLFIHA